MQAISLDRFEFSAPVCLFYSLTLSCLSFESIRLSYSQLLQIRPLEETLMKKPVTIELDATQLVLCAKYIDS